MVTVVDFTKPEPISLEQIQGRKLGTHFEESVIKRIQENVLQHTSWLPVLEAFSNICGMLRYTLTPVTYDSVKMIVDLDERDNLNILKVNHKYFKVCLDKICLSFVISST